MIRQHQTAADGYLQGFNSIIDSQQLSILLQGQDDMALMYVLNPGVNKMLVEKFREFCQAMCEYHIAERNKLEIEATLQSRN